MDRRIFLSCIPIYNIYTTKMRRSTLLYILAIHLVFVFTVLSQVSEPDLQQLDSDVEDIIDRVSDYVPEERLLYYQSHPLDLNTATKEEISQFPLLNPVEAQLILAHISKHRPLLSILELQTIEGISLELIRKIKPYICIDAAESRKSLWQSLGKADRNSIVLRWSRLLQTSKGYIAGDNSRSAYLGSPDKLFLNFKSAEPGHYSISMTAEKDAGETWFNPNYIKSFDFISAHLYLENVNSRIKSIIIGDYTLRLGQGLILDNDFSLGKTFQFGSIVKSSSIIKPYQSVRESGMFRGMASKIHLSQNASLLVFYSFNKVDGNIVMTSSTDTLESESRLSAYQTSGLHRSLSELEDKKTVSINYTGTAFDVYYKHLKMGLNIVYKYQSPGLINTDRPDRLFVSEQRSQHFASVHHQYIIKNLTFCGEWALDKSGNHAIIQNLIIGLGKKAESMISWRNFHPGFYSDGSNTLSTSTLSWNEKGLYMALNVNPVRKISLSVSADFTHYPWLKYQNDLLTSRQEYAIRIQFTERKKWLSYVQFRKKNKELNEIFENSEKEKEIFFQHGYQLRFNLESKLNADWTWRVRVESHWISEKNRLENGLSISQDLLFKSNESKFSGNLRLAIFDISDYETRIYQFENDVLYQYSLPAYNGRGIRTYINLRFQPISRIKLDFRVSNSYYFDENQNGTSQDFINSV
jgi:hypothetical protein